MKRINEMSPASRVWVFQGDRTFSSDEELNIQSECEKFLANWASHGSQLESAFEIKFSRFVVVAVDEEKALASGCGIDKLVHFMQDFGKKLNIDFFNRMIVVYRNENEIVSAPLHQFWALRKAGLITDQSVVFDNLVKTVQDYTSKWETTFETSWHAEMWGR